MASAHKILNVISATISKLKRLSDEQIEKLENGTAKFEYVEVKPKAQKVEADYSEQCKTISEFNTREEAALYITSLKLKKDGLLGIAKAFRINVSSKDTKAVIEGKIVESVVGHKVRTKALMSSN